MEKTDKIWTLEDTLWGLSYSPTIWPVDRERDHSLHQCVKETVNGMARGDSRLGTWQVLLTISMVITPLSVHGKSAGVPPCACVYVCVRVCAIKARTCMNQITPALTWYGKWQIQLFVRASSMVIIQWSFYCQHSESLSLFIVTYWALIGWFWKLFCVDTDRPILNCIDNRLYWQ